MDTITTPHTPTDTLGGDDNVYAPQSDSMLLIAAMRSCGIARGQRVADLCSGSGVAAIAAAECGASSVIAFDICARAVHCALENARHCGAVIDARHGPWSDALCCGPFDVVLSNPPYVPVPPEASVVPTAAGPPWTWNGGPDGRAVLDPLCRSAGQLLAPGGSMLLVQSALAGIRRSLGLLGAGGLHASVIASQAIPFGPVLNAHADWLERTGRVSRGCREEWIAVVRAEKPLPSRHDGH